ncbi:MAG: hypothetical protein AAF657_04475 [Acidobacteriota bacterium]
MSALSACTPRTRWPVLALATVAMLCLATNAFACSVCFGDSDHPIVKGLEASVVFLVAVTYTLLGGGVVTVILLRRRARRLAAETVQPSAEPTVGPTAPSMSAVDARA